MKCNAPTVAFRRPGINPETGNHYPPLSFRQFSKILPTSMPAHVRAGIIYDYYKSCPEGLEAVLMPCKTCALCVRAYRRMWSYRLCAEAKTCGESMFLTLTVDEDNLPVVFPDGKLDHRPFQLFMKRLRKCLSSGYSYQYVPPFTDKALLGHLPHTMETRFYQVQRLKFYMCGEYGGLTHRPHYHACIFGARFPDAYFAKRVGREAYYTSPTLLSLWPYGRMSLFSDVTPSSAAYVAGYVDKKLDGGLDGEYVRMSNGIGLEFYERYKDHLYRFDSFGDYFGEFFSSGKFAVSAPPYFDAKLRLQDPQKFDKIVASRECRRLARLAHMPVDEILNESGRLNAVLLARRKVREIREHT